MSVKVIMNVSFCVFFDFFPPDLLLVQGDDDNVTGSLRDGAEIGLCFLCAQTPYFRKLSGRTTVEMKVYLEGAHGIFVRPQGIIVWRAQ